MVVNPRYPYWQQAGGQITNFGGKATVWQTADQNLTRPANTTAYAAAGIGIGSSSSIVYSFTNFFWQPGSSGILTGLRMVCNAPGITTSNMGAVTAHLYLGSPSAAIGVSDQQAFPTLIVDDALKLGYVTFSATNWVQGGTGSNIIENYGQQIISTQHLIGLQASGATPGSGTLYVVPVTTNNTSFTPVSAAANYMYASGVMD